MLPLYYTSPENYKLYYVRTDHGDKRTYAQSTQDARRRAEQAGMIVYAVIHYPPCKTN